MPTYIALVVSASLFSGACIRNKPVPLGNGEGIMGRKEIARYDNARIRCDFKKQSSNEYQVTCVTVAFDEFGEYLARAIDPSTSIAWSDPRQIFGPNVSELSCSVGGDNLSQECLVRTQDASRVDVKHSVQLTKLESGESRSEDAVVVLPYSVSVLGKVPSLPAYQSRGQAEVSFDPNDPGVIVGLQTPEINPLQNPMSFGSPWACTGPSTSYLAAHYSIYRFRDGKLSLFAGSSRAETKGDLTHRLRLYLSGFSVGHASCNDEGIYLINDQKIYYVPEKGPVKLIRDLTFTGMGFSPPPPQLFARDAEGTLYYTREGSLRRFRPGGQELLVTAALGLGIADVVTLPDSRLVILDKAGKQVLITNAEQTSSSILVNAVDLPALNNISLSTATWSLATSAEGDIWLMGSTGISGVPNSTTLYKLSQRSAEIVFTRPSTGTRPTPCSRYQVSEAAGHSFDSHNFVDPRSFAVTSSGKLMVWDWGDCRLLEVSKTGAVTPKVVSNFTSGNLDFSPTSVADLEMPGISGLATLGNGKLYFSTTKSKGLHGVSVSSGTLQNIALANGTPYELSWELHSVPSGNIYAFPPYRFRITEPRNVYKMGANGATSIAWTIPAEIAGTWSTMSFVSDDVAFYLTMEQSMNGLPVFYSRLYRVNLQTGQYIKIAGVFPMDDPALPVFLSPVAAQDVVMSITQISAGQDGALYLLSNQQNKVHRIHPTDENAQIITVVGAEEGNSVDGAQSHMVRPGLIRAIAVDSQGRLYLSEDGVGLRLLKIVGFRFDTIPIFMLTTAVPQTLLGRDCTGGSTSPVFASTASQLSQVLSTYCVSKPDRIAISDSCQNGQGKSFLAFSQTFEGLNNIFFLERPCH